MEPLFIISAIIPISGSNTVISFAISEENLEL